MNIGIFYYSKHGATRRYAHWLSDELDADLLDIRHANRHSFMSYDLIIFGSAVYYKKIVIAKDIMNFWSKIKDKRVILFSVSGHHPHDPEIHDYVHNSLPAHIRGSINYFPLWGEIRFSRLNILEKAYLLAKGSTPLHEVKREQLNPLIEFVERHKDHHHGITSFLEDENHA